MSRQFEILNRTPFAFSPLLLADDDGRPLIVCLVKATYAIGPRGEIAPAEEPLPVNPSGVPWGDPETNSFKYEPETAPFKPATDLVFIGHAHAPRPGTTELEVRLRIGPVERAIQVVGDRTWTKALLGVTMTPPAPFERMPLVWERAFGGWDKGHANPERHTFEPRNPVGAGFRQKHGVWQDGVPLPNLVDPQRPIKNYGEFPAPAGFGFTSPHWAPRSKFAGTYGAAWIRDRKPLLPADFDPRFYNAAAPELVTQHPLTGGEPVQITNVTPAGTLSFKLPSLAPPQCVVRRHRGDQQTLACRLDTLIVNADDNLLIVLWRGRCNLRESPHELSEIEIHGGPQHLHHH